MFKEQHTIRRKIQMMSYHPQAVMQAANNPRILTNSSNHPPCLKAPVQSCDDPSSGSASQIQHATVTSEVMASTPITESLPADDVEINVPSPKDPALWPVHISDTDRLEIVRRGPFKVPLEFSFPKAPDGGHFT